MSAVVATPSHLALDRPLDSHHEERKHRDGTSASSDRFEQEPDELLERSGSSGALSDDSLRDESIRQNKRKIRKDKAAFVLGVVHFWVCAYWLGSFPSTFYKLYTLEALVLFPLRWKSFKKQKMHYYMFDFCYGANLLLLIFLWFFPKSYYLFKVLFAFNSGPLAWSIVLFSNSLVYHSLYEITSLFMHWSPMVVSWSLRWYPDCSLVPCTASSDASLLAAGIPDMLLSPMIPYLGWAVFYYLKMFVVSSKKIRERGYHTLYKYMTEDSHFNLLRNIVSRFPARCQPLVYMGIHLCLVWISLLTSVIWWKSFWAHSAWIIIATLFSAWNGASHYFQ